MVSFNNVDFLKTSDCPILQFESWASAKVKFESALAKDLSVELPASVGDSVATGSGRLIRIALRRLWLVCEDTLPAVAVSDYGCQIVLADGRVRLRLSGRNIKHILERCAPIDWENLGEGKAIQTGFHGIPTLVLRADPHCDLLVPRSFARSIAEWIADIGSAAPARAARPELVR